MNNATLPPENVFGHTKKVKFIIQRLDEFKREGARSSLHILDYGCGNGSAVTRFLCAAGHQVVGVDSHEESIDYARAHFGSWNCDFILGDWATVAGQGRRFDVVLFADVLEHVERPDELLRQARDVLLPGGRALVSIPNGFGPFEIESYISRLPVVGSLSLKLVRIPAVVMKRLLVWAKRMPAATDPIPYNEDSGHVQFFSRQRIHQLCEDAGFVVNGFAKLSFLSGPYTNSLFSRWPGFCRANAKIADWLPASMASAWFFELRMAED
jgi:SAM-dependent methyltransferase